MKRPSHNHPRPVSNGRWLFIGVLVLLVLMVFGCGCSGFVFWMMLGSPWPPDPSAFFE